jgi:hypothetical protein
MPDTAWSTPSIAAASAAARPAGAAGDAAASRASIRIRPVAVAAFLTTIAILLIVFAITGQHFRWNHGSDHHLISVFDLDDEKNPPAIFSGFLLFLAAIVVAFNARVESRIRWRRHWWVLAAGFLFMSIDETFVFHEKLGDPVQGLLGDGYPPVFHFAWVIPALVVVSLLAVAFLRFLRALPSGTRNRFLVAATLYLGGAIGMEMVGARYLMLYGSDFPQSLIIILEESLEMFGAIFFIHANLRHLADRNSRVQLRFAN